MVSVTLQISCDCLCYTIQTSWKWSLSMVSVALWSHMSVVSDTPYRSIDSLLQHTNKLTVACYSMQIMWQWSLTHRTDQLTVVSVTPYRSSDGGRCRTIKINCQCSLTHHTDQLTVISAQWTVVSFTLYRLTVVSDTLYRSIDCSLSSLSLSKLSVYINYYNMTHQF